MNLALGLGLPPGGFVSAGFDPGSLVPHLWADPSDLSTMFQERTGAGATTPSGVDDPVGSFLDKSVNGFWLTAPSDSARPILRSSGGLYWLEFDGVDDVIGVSFGGSISQPIDRVTGIRPLVDAPNTVFVGGAQLIQRFGPTLAMDAGSSLGGFGSGMNLSVGTDFVATEQYNGASSVLTIDNAPTISGDAGSGAFFAIALGATETGTPAGFNNHRFYGLVQIDGALSAPQIAQLRTYMAAKQGRVL